MNHILGLLSALTITDYPIGLTVRLITGETIPMAWI